MTPQERFWAKVDKSAGPDGCWPWTAGNTGHGYGIFQIGKYATPKSTTAHRYAYQLAYGPISSDLHVCHRCDNPPCCNPAHLFAGTQSDNMRDMVAKGRFGKRAPKTHCKRGHEFTPENTRYRKSGPYTTRNCRACDRIHEKRRFRDQSKKPKEIA